MKPILYSFIFLCSILNINYAQSSSSLDSEVLDGLDNVYNLKFDEAEDKFKQLQKSNPNDLKGYFYESLLYFYKALPTRDESMFEKYLDLSSKKPKRFLTKMKTIMMHYITTDFHIVIALCLC
jgi:hypothetical protein